jgi:carboxypeptidase family protein
MPIRYACIAMAIAMITACNSLPFVPSSADTHLGGFVLDTVGRPVLGAVVELLDGPRAGARTTSDARGAFAFRGGPTGPVTLRASRDGYESLTMGTAWSTNPDERTRVILKSLGPRLEIASGAYTMTLISDPQGTGSSRATCSGFPPELLRRTYEASISPATRYEGFDVRFTSPTLITLPGPFGFGFALTQAATFFGFELELGFGSGPTEELPGHQYVTVSGNAPTSEPAKVVDQSLIIPFAGTFEHCRLTSPLGIYNACSQVPADQRVEYHSCSSMQDLMVFTKR